MPKLVIWSATGLALFIAVFAFDRSRSETETVSFPDGYLTRERPSIFFDGHRDDFTDALLYDLVIEDIVEFVIVRNWSRTNVPGHPKAQVIYKKLTRADSRAECLAADRARQLHALLPVWRSNFDLLRGQCVIVQPVEENKSDLEMLEHEGAWSFEMRSTGRQVARAPKAYQHKEVRPLFGERAGLSIRPGSPTTKDDFADAELLLALETGRSTTAAAVRIIGRRARIEDRGIVPKITIRQAVSPKVVEAILELVSLRRDEANMLPTGFRELIPGVSAETAEVIFPKMIEMLYAPFEASKPYGPWFYGNRWKEQIRDKRPNLEKEFTPNDYVPAFASADAFRSASALALHLGQPYTGLFYEEFSTEIVNRVLAGGGPSFHTAILAQSESNLVRIISAVRAQRPSPNRMGTIWSLIAQGRNLPKAFIEELREGCDGDPEFLNNTLASQQYLDGASFCAHFFSAKGSQFRQ